MKLFGAAKGTDRKKEAAKQAKLVRARAEAAEKAKRKEEEMSAESRRKEEERLIEAQKKKEELNTAARKKEEEKARKIEEAKNKRLAKIKEAYDKSAVLLDPQISKLTTKKLLEYLIRAKRGWFGDPQVRLRSDIVQRLGVGSSEAFERGSLLAYSRLSYVDKKLKKIFEGDAKERQKKAREKAKEKAKSKAKRKVPVRRVLTNPAMARLIADLISTKKSFLGNSEKRLIKDIMKRMSVEEEQVYNGDILLTYAGFADVAKKLAKVRETRAAEETAVEEVPEVSLAETRTIPEAAKEGLPTVAMAPVSTSPVFAMPQSQEALRLFEDLKETRKGVFGNPKARLVKDITKRLNVEKGEALKDENLDAYAELQDIKAKLDDLYAQRGKKEKAKEHEGKTKEFTGKKIDMGPAGKRISLPQSALRRPELTISTTVAPEISERSRIIDSLLEEQKRLEEVEAAKKALKKKSRKAIGAPFRLVGKAINYVIEKIFHLIFLVFTTILSIPITLGRLLVHGAGGLLQGIYRRVGRFSPFGWKKKVNQLIIYSGVNKTQEEITGITIVNGSILAAIVAVVGILFFNWGIPFALFAALISFAVVWMLVYSLLNLMADKRTDEVEGTLPDVLQIVSANISAGMTPYNALWVSARKEFGALAEEIKIAQKETLGGKSFPEALTDMSRRVRSNVLQRTIRLIIQGMKAGGELPNILQGIGSDIRQMRLLQKEMAASTMSYTLFILFGMVFGAPLLFSVSIQFVDIINKFQPDEINKEAISSAQTSPMSGGMQGFNVMSLGGGGCPKDFDGDGLPDKWEKEQMLNPKNYSDAMSIDPDTRKTYKEEYDSTAQPLPPSCITPGYLSTFAMIALFSIAFFGSLLIGLIRDGKQSAGLKLMPLLIPGTLGMFWLMSKGMSFFFGSMFGT